MASDRDTLVSEVKYILGNRDDLDTRYPDWVRRAYAHLTQAIEFREASKTVTLATVINTRAYALPADFMHIYSARNNTTDRKLIQVSPAEYDRLDTAIAGAVERYAIFDGNFNVHPTPSTSETLQKRYRKIFTDLVLGTSVHELPDVWDQPIIHLAASYAFMATNEIERVRFYRGEVNAFVRAQRNRIVGDLFDRNEAMAVIGGEIK